MRTFETIDELWFDAAEQVAAGQRVESRDGVTKEVMGYVARLEDPRYCFLYNPRRNINAAYAAAEVIWYLSFDNDIEMIQAYAPQYDRFAEGGKAHRAYGLRLSTFDQFEFLLGLLSKKLTTRQAVLNFHSNQKPFYDLRRSIEGDRKDIPCTLSLNFLVRDNKLNMTATMRSNDLWLGLPYDIFAFCHIQQLVARYLGIDMGWYQHQAMSLHIYDRNQKAFEEARTGKDFSVDHTDYFNGAESYRLFDKLEALGGYEAHNRTMGLCAEEIEMAGTEKTMLGQLLIMASSKFDSFGAWSKRISSKILLKHMKKED